MRVALTRVERHALAAATFAAIAPSLFALVSAAMHARSPEPDPAAVLWSARSALVERAAVTGYVTIAVAALAGPWLVKRPSIAARAFEAAIASSVVAAIVGGALWP